MWGFGKKGLGKRSKGVRFRVKDYGLRGPKRPTLDCTEPVGELFLSPIIYNLPTKP